jgi:hypothetical protein
MNLTDPHVQASLWALAFVISELVGASKLKENSLVQLGLKLFRIVHGSLSKKVSK